jgi:hypothetical protein
MKLMIENIFAEKGKNVGILTQNIASFFNVSPSTKAE